MSCKTARYIILSIAVAGAVAACGNRGGSKAAAGAESLRKDIAFPEAAVPAMLTDPGERIEYVLEHFWDGFFGLSGGLCDSSYSAGVSKEVIERQFGTFSTLLWMAPVHTAADAVASLFRKAEAAELGDTASNVFETITDDVVKYLYDPNSPVRNEEFYLPYVSGLSVSVAVSEDMKPAYGYEAQMCSLNRIGTPAADFEFTDRRGRIRRLYGVKADYVLLFFSNPGCPDCKNIAQALTGSEGMSALMKDGKLAVVNIYIDREIDKWREYSSEYPAEWITGYDHNYIIREDRCYNVRAIPSLYMLDADKKVLLKDAPADKVFEILEGALVKEEQKL